MAETSAQKYARWPKMPRIGPPVEEALLVNYSRLQQIGLTRSAARCYGYLVIKGHYVRAEELYRNLNLSRVTIYRAMEQLEKRGFIEKLRIGTLQTMFLAVALDMAMANYAEYQRKLVVSLILEQRQQL